MSVTMIEAAIWLNRVANRCGELLLTPVAVLPGWLSATLVAIVTGVLMLLIFKYTSRQRAVRQVRDQIKAQLLALSLFQESVVVSLRAQARLIAAAGQLLGLAVVPMLVMLLPMGLLLGQLALWYQARPLRVGEETVLTVLLADHVDPLPAAQLHPTAAITNAIGPVRVPSKQMICWTVRAVKEGYHSVKLDVGEQSVTKEIAVGDGFMRVSQRRPGRSWSEIMLHPRETPLAKDSLVQGIEIAYPGREGWTCGTDTWLAYWFVVSLIAAFVARPVLKVHI